MAFSWTKFASYFNAANRPDGSTPHNMSEFYSYDHNLAGLNPPSSLSYTAASTSTISFTFNEPAGATRVYFFQGAGASFTLFENLLNKLKYDLITILFNLKLIEQNDDQNDIQNEKSINTNNNPKCLLVTNREGKISRNERCEATGKKFKHCCGAL